MISTERCKKDVKRCKKNNFYISILNQIQQGKNVNQTAHALKTSRQSLNYYIKKMKKEGFVTKKHYGIWQINKDVKKSSLGTSGILPTTNLHALQINFPILEGQIKDKDWEIKEKLKNWIPKYTTLPVLDGLTLKNNNNKSLTIFADSRDIKDLQEIDDLAFKIRTFAYEFFKTKHNVILDIFNCETKNLNIATEDKEAEGMIRKGEKVELNLNKKCEKIFNNDKIDAKAWVDGSPFKFTAESNDKEWVREYLKMPFTIQDTNRAVNYIAQNYYSHVRVVVESKKTMKELKGMAKENKEMAKEVKELLKKLNNKQNPKKI